MKEETVKNSEIAYQILRAFYNSEEKKGLYSKEVQERVDASEDSVKKYIKALRDLGFIKRTKRTRRQYYNLDLEGIYEFWTQDIIDRSSEYAEEQDFEGYEETIEEFKEEIKTDRSFEELEIDTSKPTARQYGDGEYGDVTTFLYRYIPAYLNEVESSTINQMLYQDVKLGFDMLSSRKEPGDLLYQVTIPHKLGLLLEILTWIESDSSHELVAIKVLRQEMRLKKAEQETGKKDTEEAKEELNTEELMEKSNQLRDSIKYLYTERDFSEEAILDIVQESIRDTKRD